jgi:hypothetical protein
MNDRYSSLYIDFTQGEGSFLPKNLLQIAGMNFFVVLLRNVF